MGLVTGTAVATIYYSSVRLGLPVPTAWALISSLCVSQQLGSWPVAPVMGRKSILP